MTWLAAEREIVFRMRSLNMQTGGPSIGGMVATSLGRESYPIPSISTWKELGRAVFTSSC